MTVVNVSGISSDKHDETANSEEEIGTLPSDAVLINVARGGIVDTPRLAEALQVGELRGAALDITKPNHCRLIINFGPFRK